MEVFFYYYYFHLFWILSDINILNKASGLCLNKMKLNNMNDFFGVVYQSLPHDQYVLTALLWDGL